MNIKKIVFASLFAIAPPLSIILTTPFASLSEHSVHIFLFALLGIGMAAYILREDIATKKRKFIPSFTTIIFSLAILFVLTHFMPCPYMLSPQTEQTMIDHPCSQPTTPGIAMISFTPIIALLGTIVISSPVIVAFVPVTTTDSRSPPFI